MTALLARSLLPPSPSHHVLQQLDIQHISVAHLLNKTLRMQYAPSAVKEAIKCLPSKRGQLVTRQATKSCTKRGATWPCASAHTAVGQLPCYSANCKIEHVVGQRTQAIKRVIIGAGVEGMIPPDTRQPNKAVPASRAFAHARNDRFVAKHCLPRRVQTSFEALHFVKKKLAKTTAAESERCVPSLQNIFSWRTTSMTST